MRSKLSPEMIFAINKIRQYSADVVFGGSIALSEVGLLDREIKDIDIFLGKTSAGNRLANYLLSISEPGDAVNKRILSDTVTDIDGKKIRRRGICIEGVPVCMFEVSEEELQHSIVPDFAGGPLKIQNVNHCIRAKMAYAKKNPKHQDDLNVINAKLETV